MISFKRLTLILSIFVFTACGGGGGGGGSSTPETPPQNVTITFTISATQINLGQSVTLNWSSQNATSCTASGDWSGNKPTSGSETLTPDSAGQKTYTLTCSSSSGQSASSSVSTNVVVPNDPPTFDGLQSSYSIPENTTEVLTIQASDPDGDTLTFSIAGIDQSFFTLTGSDLSFSSAPDFEAPADSNADNIYNIVLGVSDSNTEVTQAVAITVTDVADSFAITGTILSSPFNIVDNDVPNLPMYPFGTNNDSSEAQPLTNPTEVVGHIGDNSAEVIVIGDDGSCVEDPDNPGYCLTEIIDNVDPEDWFSLSAAPNLKVSLYVEGLLVDNDDGTSAYSYDGIDVSLLLYNSDGTLADFAYTSASDSLYQEIVMPDSGDFFIVVKSNTGHSKYVLQLGSNDTGTSAQQGTNYFADSRFISYIPFGSTFDPKTYSPNLLNLNDNDSLSHRLDKLSISGNKGLTKLPFDMETEFQEYFSYVDVDALGTSNLTQINYLKQWKILIHYREKFPNLNLDFDYKIYADSFVADPYWNYQWNLQAIGLSEVLTAVGLETQDVAVAVTDTGSPNNGSTAWNATEFIAGGYDFVDITNGFDGDGYDPDPTDSQAAVDSHGTHVASTIAAKNEGAWINGFGVKVLPMRVLGHDGSGYVSDSAEALLYVAGLPNASGTIYAGSTPVRVINMSLGYIGGGCINAYQAVINDVFAQNISIVSSSGNSGSSMPGSYGYPASCENVISVGATDIAGARAYYSTFNDMVDIAAPGGTTGTDLNGDGVGDGVPAFANDNSIQAWQGTSMASPHVAASLAVLYAIAPDLTASQMDGFITSGYLTDDVGLAGKDDEYGYGALNLIKGFSTLVSDEGLDFTYGRIDPSNIVIDSDTNNFTITIEKVGDGELSVTEVITNDYMTVASESIDSDGFGTYSVTIDRGTLPDGVYQYSVRFNLSNDSYLNSTVSLQVGDIRARPSVGMVTAYLYDYNLEEVVFAGRLDLDGEFNYILEDVAPGDYYWLHSTNIDSNGYINDRAELAESNPESSNANQYFSVIDSDVEVGPVVITARKRANANIEGLTGSLKIKISEFNTRLPEK